MTVTRSLSLAEIRKRAATRHAVAWIVLAFSLALHMVDEWLAGSPRSVWLSAAALAALLAFSRSVVRGKRWALPLSYGFAGLLMAKGVLHLGAFVYFRRPVPGIYSSLLLIAGAVNLIVCAGRRNAAG